MLRFLFALLAFLLIAAPSYAHGVAHGALSKAAVDAGVSESALDAGVDAAPAAPLSPAHSRHHGGQGDATQCGDMVSCTPLFHAETDAVGPAEFGGSPWPAAPEHMLIAATPEREPPVPRIHARS